MFFAMAEPDREQREYLPGQTERWVDVQKARQIEELDPECGTDEAIELYALESMIGWCDDE